jgi:anti-anti-sigma factor
MGRRGLGVRSYLVLAMMIVSIGSVAFTGLLVRRGVAEELAEHKLRSAADITDCVLRAVLEAGLASIGLALLLALPVAMQVARPLRRLNELASRMARGESSTAAAVAVGGGRELGELGATLGRLAATLRRQDQVRRSTAADVTHELRGGLSGVIGGVEGIEDGVIDRSVGLRLIAADARRMGRVLDDLGLLVEAQRPGPLVQKQPIDLAAVLHERAAAHRRRFEAAGIALRLTIGPATVLGDRERLAQVADNLLANALRYTDPGGCVTVSLSCTQRESVIDVADTGIGIPAEHITRVFDRFWRAPGARDRTAAGSGVGLAVVRDLVLSHQGRVEVDSRVGEGSRFSVHLPLARPRDAAAAPERPLGAPAPLVWRLHGDIDIANASQIQRELLKQIWTTTTDLRLDLSDVGFFGSSGLAILAAADTEMRARGGRIVIVAAPPGVRRLLHLVGLPGPPAVPPAPSVATGADALAGASAPVA